MSSLPSNRNLNPSCRVLFLLLTLGVAYPVVVDSFLPSPATTIHHPPIIQTKLYASIDQNAREELDSMQVPELKDRLRVLGLKVGGRKSELIERILCHGDDSVDQAAAERPSTVLEEEEEAPPTHQDSMDTPNSNEEKATKESVQDVIRGLKDVGYDGRLPSKNEEYRCGFVSIVGAPNMGKSTLMNALVQEDLCVATRRPQTTRHAIMGVVTTDECQLCLVDTPGIIDNPAYKLQEGMMEAVIGAFHDADVLLVVTDLFSTPIPDDNLFAKVQQSRKPVVVAINKIDLANRINPDSDENQEEGRTVNVIDAIARWRSLLPNAMAILPIAASEGVDNAGVVALRKILLGGGDVPAALRDLGRPIQGMFPADVKTISEEEAKALLPQGPPLYSDDTLTDRPERFFASEMIRAALFQTLKKEVPYCCEVRVEAFKEPKPGAKKQVIHMSAVVLVERDSQKGIVVGKGGEQIKKVGMMARRKLESFFQTQVMLELNVKVDKDWRKNEKKLKEYGYMKQKK